MALPVTIASLIPPYAGPYKSSVGNYYVFGYTSTLAAYKATDPTSSFSSVDTEGTIPDLRALRGVQVGDTINLIMAYGNSGLNGSIRFITFDMSTDTFGTMQDIATALNFASSTAVLQHFCDLVVRSDGSMIALFNTENVATMGSDYSRVAVCIRNSSGVWGATLTDITAGGTIDWRAAAAELGSSDRTHLMYRSLTDNIVYHRTLTGANSLQANSNSGAVLLTTLPERGVSYDLGGTIKIVLAGSVTGGLGALSFDSADSVTWSSIGATFGSGVSSTMLETLNNGSDLWALYQQTSSDDNVMAVKSTDHGATWGTAVLAHDLAANATAVSDADVVYTRGGNTVIPFVTFVSPNSLYNEYALPAEARRQPPTRGTSYAVTRASSW